jgi:hypothetical protein
MAHNSVQGTKASVARVQSLSEEFHNLLASPNIIRMSK